MTITKKPTKTADTAAEDAFISGAPDAPHRVRKGRKIQITLTIAEPLLARVDELAAQLGQSRASVINLGIAQILESGFRIEGRQGGLHARK